MTLCTVFEFEYHEVIVKKYQKAITSIRTHPARSALRRFRCTSRCVMEYLDPQ